ncbi:hypothetical protein HK104_007380, partial [Borealophlyctis nickersoniae]
MSSNRTNATTYTSSYSSSSYYNSSVDDKVHSHEERHTKVVPGTGGQPREEFSARSWEEDVKTGE